MADGRETDAWRSAHLVLLGLPGAGKSTVGPMVARQLARRFVDLDEVIEQRAGRRVSEIFAQDGEAGFRVLEGALTRELLAPGSDPLVCAPGGGWVESAANRRLLGAGVVAVYLRVSAAVALARMAEAVADRPLLVGSDPLSKLREILARREPLYLQSQHTVSVDWLSPDEVAASIVALARGEIGD